MKGGPKVERPECDRETVAELRFRAQMIHLGLSERTPIEETLQRMRTTNLQDLDYLRFKEWTQELKGLEFVQIMTVPYEAPNVKIVMEDLTPEDGILVLCTNQEALARTHPRCMVNVGEAVQIDSKTWCLMTAHSVKECVKPENLEKAWKSLVRQPLASRKLFLQAFDWYRGAFHFQDWYRLVTACTPREWNLHIVASRTYQFSPRISVRAALNLVDSWMRINGEDQQLPRAIWVDLDDICPPKDSPETDPPVGRTIRYKDTGSRPDYSAFISYSTEDFLQVQGTLVMAMPADLNPRSAMAKAILREYDKEEIFRLRPKVGSVIHVDSTITGHPEVNLLLLIVRSSQRQVAMMEDLYSALREVAARFSDDNSELLHFPMLDMERGLNHLPNLYALLDEIFHRSAVGIVLHDRAFVTIGSVQETKEPP